MSQTAAMSPAMMAQFKKLPKAEQQRLLKQYGLKASDLKKQSAKDKSLEAGDTADYLEEEPEEKEQPVEEVGEKKAERFGLNLFKRQQNVSLENVPVPDTYIVGPGDQLLLQVFGKESLTEELIVERNGTVSIPDIGAYPVSGLTFAQTRQLLSEKIKAQMLGVEVALSMAELRTITVFVAGEVNNPGSYAVPAMATVSSVLTMSKGISDIGSLRQIQISRDGEVIGNFDVYDLLLRGDASGDIPVQQGDVILVKPVAGLVEVVGEVVRPAIYEVKPGETVAKLLEMAGGAKPGAFTQNAIVERVNKQNVRDLLNLDLTSAEGLQVQVKAGDVLRLGSTSPRFENEVVVAGAVVRPGKYAFKQGMRVNNLIQSFWSDLHTTADLEYALLVREVNYSGEIKLFQFDLAEAVNNPASADNMLLQPRDQILVFHHEDKAFDRQILNEFFRKKAEKAGWFDEESILQFQKAREENGNSEVKQKDGLALQVESLVDQAFDLILEKQKTTQLFAESRQWANEEKWLMAEFQSFLDKSLSDPEILAKTVHLRRSELLFGVLEKLKSGKNALGGQRIVSISGEVKVPGEYPLVENSSVKGLIAAAGGLKGSAFLDRAELTRAFIEPETGDMQVKHVSFSLRDVLAGREVEDLQTRDKLNIFAIPNWNIERQVRLTGMVRFPGVYTIVPGEKLSNVLQRAGGLKPEAFAEGAVFTRLQTRQRESEQIQKLSQQLRADIAARSLTPDGAGIAPQEAMAMIAEIEKVKPVGRLVVDINGIEKADPGSDIVAEDGDELFVPPMNTAISVVGEVQHASSHRYKKELMIEDYLALAGGVRKRADAERVYIIRADGSVYVPQSSKWFAVAEQNLKPGDTVVVPLDTEFKDSMTLWTQVTQIFYQSAVALAAINSF
jgi:protein involved in polysaccharide export with SLBB domain